jgi:hypothetical protein
MNVRLFLGLKAWLRTFMPFCITEHKYISTVEAALPATSYLIN